MNISLDEFQRLSTGDYNAGEVRLAGETKLAKMNNHVGSFFVNKDIISHEEVIAIKQALVKALSQNGVSGDELNRIRKDLGLAPRNASDLDLCYRSIMPLSRQQIRQILDDNAAAINHHNEEHGGDVHIRTTADLNPEGVDVKRAQTRDAVNAKLVEYDRKVDVNDDIARFSLIMSNSVDFVDFAERSKVKDMLNALLTSLMEKCAYQPSADRPATAQLDLPNGRTIDFPTGLSEKEFAEHLENVLARFCHYPLDEEIDVVDSYSRCKTDDERKDFLANLANDRKCGLKARALAIRCLYGRGVTDAATLEVANRLNRQDALKLATKLLAMPKNSTPDQMRAN